MGATNDVPEIPEPVLRFLSEMIDSVPQLEALLLLAEDPNRSWDCDELASRIYVAREGCIDLLEPLRRRGLVVADETDRHRYRYSATWDPSGARLAEVAAAYRAQLVRISTLIHAKAPAAIREFAASFNLKREN
jgi:hypothetical protein